MTSINPYEAPQTTQATTTAYTSDASRSRWIVVVSYLASAVLFALLSVTSLLVGCMALFGGPHWISWTSLLATLILAFLSLVLVIRGVWSWGFG